MYLCLECDRDACMPHKLLAIVERNREAAVVQGHKHAR